VADGVDATMDAVELPATDTERDPFGTEARIFKLTPRRYSVLPSGEFRDLGIKGVDFWLHMDA
jgi:hypothetical protein